MLTVTVQVLVILLSRAERGGGGAPVRAHGARERRVRVLLDPLERRRQGTWAPARARRRAPRRRAARWGARCTLLSLMPLPVVVHMPAARIWFSELICCSVRRMRSLCSRWRATRWPNWRSTSSPRTSQAKRTPPSRCAGSNHSSAFAYPYLSESTHCDDWWSILLRAQFHAYFYHMYLNELASAVGKERVRTDALEAMHVEAVRQLLAATRILTYSWMTSTLKHSYRVLYYVSLSSFSYEVYEYNQWTFTILC